MSGTIAFDGEPIAGRPAQDIVRRGLVHVQTITCVMAGSAAWGEMNLRIVDADHEDVPHGEIGELSTLGPSGPVIGSASKRQRAGHAEIVVALDSCAQTKARLQGEVADYKLPDEFHGDGFERGAPGSGDALVT